MTRHQPSSESHLPVDPDILPVTYQFQRQRQLPASRSVASEDVVAGETGADAHMVHAGGITVPSEAWPPSNLPSPQAVSLPTAPVAPPRLAPGHVIAINAFGSIAGTFYRVDNHDTRRSNRSITRLIPAGADRRPIQAIGSGQRFRLRESTADATLADGATLHLAPDPVLAGAYLELAGDTSQEIRSDGGERPPVSDPADPTSGAHVTTVGDHEIITADSPDDRDRAPTHAPFVLQCADCEYIAHPHIRDTGDLASFAATEFDALHCPPEIGRHLEPPACSSNGPTVTDMGAEQIDPETSIANNDTEMTTGSDDGTGSDGESHDDTGTDSGAAEFM